VGLVEGIPFVDRLEVVQLSSQKHGGGVAVFLNVADTMGNDEHGTVAALLE
jgi:hypothetical protein